MKKWINGLQRGKYIISIQYLSSIGLKKPVLLIQDTERNCANKVASFNNEETADLFCEAFGLEKGVEDDESN